MAPRPSSTSDEGGNGFDIFKQLSNSIDEFAHVLGCGPNRSAASDAVILTPWADKDLPSERFKESTAGRNSEGTPVGEQRSERQPVKASAAARRQKLPALDSPGIAPDQPTSAPPLPPTNASTAKQEQANPVVSRPRSAEQASVSRTPSAEQAPVSRTPSTERVPPTMR
ncbi:hypothetical protein T484DRAFT_1743828 [Baffinella frigidus]|nr:hypothetical protein T484DRAFT_1743828 [Cryptophyta sp. CCMP2293]